MNVKTIAFDMDGTILNEQKELDKVLIEIAPKLQAQGIELIIASGRLSYMTYVYLHELGINHTPIISCNGAQIVYRDTATPIHAAIFPLATTEQLIQQAKSLGVLFHIFTLEGLIGETNAGRLAYYSDTNESKETEDQVPILLGETYFSPEYLKNAVKFLVVSTDEQKVEQFWQYAESLGLEVVSSGDGLTDVMLKGVSKGSALQILHDKGLIDLATTMAFGDNYNDIEMLKTVKYPIVMENGEAEVKELAYDICGNNEENGVGNYLKKLFLTE